VICAKGNEQDRWLREGSGELSGRCGFYALCYFQMTHSKPRFNRQELALLILTMVWGGTFFAIQQALTVSGPLFFVGIRFLIATMFILLISARTLRGLTRREVQAGITTGASIYVGFVLLAYGLQTISSSKAAFITALYVPAVPILQWGFLRKPPRLMSWIGIGFAFAGLLLLAGPEAGSGDFGWGEILTLLGAVSIAVEIILIGRYAGSVDSRRITVVQVAVTSFLAFATMPIAREMFPPFSWLLVGIACGLGLASAGIQVTMNWAQKSVSPTRATVIYACEPVWAGLVGYAAGERITAFALIGASLIVTGVLVSEWKSENQQAPA